MKRPRVDYDNLIIPRAVAMMEQLTKPQQAPVDEATTSIALNPLLLDILSDGRSGPWRLFGIMARTSILFLIDGEEFDQAFRSTEEAPVLPELPPLPYRRIAVEAIQDMVWPLGDINGNHAMDVEAFLISEEREGEEWFVVMLMREAGPPGVWRPQTPSYLHVYTLRRDGSVVAHSARGAPNNDQLRQLASGEISSEDFHVSWESSTIPTGDPRGLARWVIPVEAAHFINARGVTVDEHGIDRAERRRAQRDGWRYPTTYLVYIGDGTGEDVERGRSDRVYHCRWMVRGHWRHYPDHKTWIRPYIKGPAGAPWRGRPIYVAPAEVA